MKKLLALLALSVASTAFAGASAATAIVENAAATSNVKKYFISAP